MGMPPENSVFFSIMCFFLQSCICNFIVFAILVKILKNLPINNVIIATIIAVIIVATIGYTLGLIDGKKK